MSLYAKGTSEKRDVVIRIQEILFLISSKKLDTDLGLDRIKQLTEMKRK